MPQTHLLLQFDDARMTLPRLRSCSNSLTVQQEYAAEVREDLEAITRLVEVSSCITLFYSLIMECQ